MSTIFTRLSNIRIDRDNVHRKSGSGVRLALTTLMVSVCVLLSLSISACTQSSSVTENSAPDVSAQDIIVATVNGTQIMESAVEERIAQTRAGDPALSGDEDWTLWLKDQGYTPNTYRQMTINALTDETLINQAALENGIIISEEEIDASIEPIKSGYGTEEDWLSALEKMGYTEQQYRDETRTALIYQQLQSVIDDSYPELAEIENPQDKLAAYLGKLHEIAVIEIVGE